MALKTIVDLCQSLIKPYINDNDKAIYEVMGRNGAKNLLKSSLKTNTYDGLTFTVGADGSVTLSGTAASSCGVNGWGNFGAFSYPAGKYILSDGGAGSQASNKRMYYKINNGSSQGVVDSADITLADGDLLMVWIYVDQGVAGDGSVFYPMLRLASDVDDSYEPYAKTNQELTEAVQPVPVMLNDLGAKNLAPITYDSIKAALATSSIVLDSNNQATKNGITFTLTLDADGFVSKCNVNGTASADTYFRLWVTPTLNSFGSDSLNSILYPTKGNYTISSGTDSEDVAFVYQPNISNEYSGFYIRIDNGKAVNVDIYPMLRYASISEDTYAPYIKTNKELTSEIHKVITDVFEVTTPAFSSLPQTFTAPGITADHELIVDGSAMLSNPSSQGGDWTISTGNNSITISGTFAGSTATTVKMTLGIKRAITATV